MLAARNGHPEAIKVLIAAGADLNAKENLRNTTALMWAVEQRIRRQLKPSWMLEQTFEPAPVLRVCLEIYMAARVDTAGVEAAVGDTQTPRLPAGLMRNRSIRRKNGIVHEGRRAAAQPARPAAAAVAQSAASCRTGGRY